MCFAVIFSAKPDGDIESIWVRLWNFWETVLHEFYLQIWLYCLEETAWWKGAVYPAGTLVRMAGSGAEENRYCIYHAAVRTSSIDFGSFPDP
jgi:hypothetical protein